MELKPTFSDDRSEKLEHYGVKGMKWGKRKALNKISDEVRNQADVIYDESGIDRTKSKTENDRTVARNAKSYARDIVGVSRNSKRGALSFVGQAVKGAKQDAKVSKAGSRRTKGKDRVQKILKTKRNARANAKVTKQLKYAKVVNTAQTVRNAVNDAK